MIFKCLCHVLNECSCQWKKKRFTFLFFIRKNHSKWNQKISFMAKWMRFSWRNVVTDFSSMSFRKRNIFSWWTIHWTKMRIKFKGRAFNCLKGSERKSNWNVSMEMRYGRLISFRTSEFPSLDNENLSKKIFRLVWSSWRETKWSDQSLWKEFILAFFQGIRKRTFNLSETLSSNWRRRRRSICVTIVNVFSLKKKGRYLKNEFDQSEIFICLKMKMI